MRNPGSPMYTLYFASTLANKVELLYCNAFLRKHVLQSGYMHLIFVKFLLTPSFLH